MTRWATARCSRRAPRSYRSRFRSIRWSGKCARFSTRRWLKAPHPKPLSQGEGLEFLFRGVSKRLNFSRLSRARIFPHLSASQDSSIARRYKTARAAAETLTDEESLGDSRKKINPSPWERGR